jgi:type II secretory pathway component PulF
MKQQLNIFQKIYLKTQFNDDARYKFFIKLSQLLKNGVTLDSALEQIARIAKRRRQNFMYKIYNHWRLNIANGLNLGQCLTGYISNSESVLIETGANTGKLIHSLEYTADMIQQKIKIKKAIIGAAAYPTILLVMLIFIMILASNMVIPTLEEFVPPEFWTGISYLVSVTAKFIRDYTIIIFLSFSALVAFIIYTLPRWTGDLRTKFDRLPPWNFYRIWQGSSFLLAISSIMSAGIKLDEVSMGRLSKQASPYLKQRINSVVFFLISGENLGNALYRTGYEFPEPEIIDDLQIYAQLKGFDQNLRWIVKTWVDSLVEQVKIKMQVFNMIVLFFIAVVIGGLILAFYDIFQQVENQV